MKQNCSKVNALKEASFGRELHSQQLLAIRPQNSRLEKYG